MIFQCHTKYPVGEDCIFKMESCLKRISSIFGNLQVTIILKTKIDSLNIVFIHSILSRCQDECNVNIILISKQFKWHSQIPWFVLCSFLFKLVSKFCSQTGRSRL